jgi:glycosyltransferase involved in cell wall biosynthesis
MMTGLARWTLRRPAYDVCFVGFYGQPLTIALSKLQSRPIVFDAYISTYDTLCHDRKWFPPNSPLGRFAFWLDWRSCQVSARVITDTQAHARYFAETFDVPEDRMTSIYVGCDETIFQPVESEVTVDGLCRVFYYGSFLPLHGTDVIVEAAALLRDRPDIEITIGGDGAGRSGIQRLIADRGLSNIRMPGWIGLIDLPSYIARASICLGGHFSTVSKAARVVSTKTFQFVAMRKPTIVGDNAATRELFVSGEHVVSVPMGDAAALANAIRQLADDAALRSRIADGGHSVFRERLTMAAIADRLAPVVEEAARMRRQ